MTITTVGYGDQYPVSNTGRIVGIFVMTAGVGLFGTLSGFLANLFLAPSKAEEPKEAAAADSNDPKAKIAELKRLIEAQEKATADLKAKLDEFDGLLDKRMARTKRANSFRTIYGLLPKPTLVLRSRSTGLGHTK